MIFSQAVALQQVQSLLQCYKELKVVTVGDSQIKLSGNIEINREWNDVRLNKDYSITIIIPIESNQVPYVIDGHCQSCISEVSGKASGVQRFVARL